MSNENKEYTKKKIIGIDSIIVIIAISVVLNITLMGLNKVYYSQSNRLLINTVTNHREGGFTDYVGFGFGITVLEDDSEKTEESTVEEKEELIYNVYNKQAGSLDTWNSEMNLSEFNEYKNDLIQVNGMIVNSDLQEDYITYTFANDKELKVNFVNNTRKTFDKDVSSGDVPIKTSETDGVTYEEYSNGVVREIYKADSGTADTVNQETDEELVITFFDFVNFIITVVITIALLSVGLIAYHIAYNHFKVNKNKTNLTNS